MYILMGSVNLKRFTGLDSLPFRIFINVKRVAAPHRTMKTNILSASWIQSLAITKFWLWQYFRLPYAYLNGLCICYFFTNHRLSKNKYSLLFFRDWKVNLISSQSISKNVYCSSLLLLLVIFVRLDEMCDYKYWVIFIIIYRKY